MFFIDSWPLVVHVLQNVTSQLLPVLNQGFYFWILMPNACFVYYNNNLLFTSFSLWIIYLTLILNLNTLRCI